MLRVFATFPCTHFPCTFSSKDKNPFCIHDLLFLTPVLSSCWHSSSTSELRLRALERLENSGLRLHEWGFYNIDWSSEVSTGSVIVLVIENFENVIGLLICVHRKGSLRVSGKSSALSERHFILSVYFILPDKECIFFRSQHQETRLMYCITNYCFIAKKVSVR